MSPSTVSMGVQFLVVTAGAFVVIALVYSVWKFEQLAQVARGPVSQTLDSRESFLIRVATRMSGWNTGSRPLSVVVLEAFPRGGGTAVPGEDLVRILAKASRTEVDEFRVLGPIRAGGVLDCPPDLFPSILRRWEQRTGFKLRAGISGLLDPAPTAEESIAAAERAFRDAPVVPSPADLPGAPTQPGSAAGEPPMGDPRIVDPLTGVLRSERIGPAALKFLARWRREGRRVSLLLFEFDSLAGLNERYGREAGDEALRNMGRMLETTIRETDLIGRLGEDAFLVLAPGDGESALRIGRRILDVSAKSSSGSGGVRVKGSISAGVAEAPGDAREYPDLLRCARLALARGRRTGRGRCTRYQPEMQRTRDGFRLAPQDRF